VAAITLDGLSKTFAHGPSAVRDVNLAIADGEFLALVGPSGCGKSTLLRLIAGLEALSTGRIVIGETDATAVPPQARDLAMVFQSYALYPHMTVRENLAYGLRVRRIDRTTVRARVATVAGVLGLDALLDRYPAQLSGGQRQRVALGRAMVREPKAFLLDEPLSNLDPGLRAQARAELLRLHGALHATMVYVTHDQEEAMTLGTRVAVMRHGAIEQVAPPMELYARPSNTFVAQFIGSPAMNLIAAPIPGLDVEAGTLVGIRPHDISISATGSLRATVDIVEPRGPDAVVWMRTVTAAGPANVAVVTEAPPAPGSHVGLSLRRDRVHLFDPSTGARLDRSIRQPA
jgi:multiple sugar transport system ATP-binding protein